MSANLLLSPQQVFADANGKPYAGGLLSTYVPGTLTQKPTWQDANQTIYNTNPIELDVRGACVVYGDGDYRMILTDADSNQVFDLLSSEPLPASAIGAILPCLASQTLQQFLDCSGTTALVNAAVSAIELEPGPLGPAGPTGPRGVGGPTGPSGADASLSFSMANPGYIQLGAYGSSPLINFGFNASDGSGRATVSFARPYTTTVSGVTGTCVAPEGIWVNPTSTSNSGFTAITMTPYAPGSTFFGPVGFFWIAIGQ